MRILNYFATTLPLLFAAMFSSPSTQAADFNGAWATDASVCSKVLVKKDDKVSLTPDAELYGGGLIVEGSRVTGTFQNCRIKSRKDDGANFHFVAACSTGVMVSELQVTAELVGDDKMTLSVAGPVSIETTYVRCSL